MLYDVVVNDWGETTYVPTTLGNVLLVVLLFALLALAVFFARRHTAAVATKATNDLGISANPSPKATLGSPATAKFGSGKLSAKQLTFCAMAMALGTILSMLSLYDFPFGGSITWFSMLMICLPGYWFGPATGMITGVAYGVLQLLIEPYVLTPFQLLVDYPLAFGSLGLSGLFACSKNGLLKGYLTAIVGRWVFAVLSGWIFFRSYAWEGWAPLPYSMAYNGCYIFAEGAITFLILAIPTVKDAFARIKRLAIE